MKYDTRRLLSQYAECRERITAATIAALVHAAPSIESKFPPILSGGDGFSASDAGTGLRGVSGVGLYLDTEQTFLLYLRNNDEQWGDLTIADYPENWQNEVFSDPDSVPEISDFVAWVESWAEEWEQQYEGSDSLGAVLEHLLSLAAAEALFDKRVFEELRRQSINASPLSEVADGSRVFRYVVRGQDDPFTVNYCDLVLALHYTAQISSGVALRKARDEQREAGEGRELLREFLGFSSDSFPFDMLPSFLSWLLKNKK